MKYIRAMFYFFIVLAFVAALMIRYGGFFDGYLITISLFISLVLLALISFRKIKYRHEPIALPWIVFVVLLAVTTILTLYF